MNVIYLDRIRIQLFEFRVISLRGALIKLWFNPFYFFFSFTDYAYKQKLFTNLLLHNQYFSLFIYIAIII